MIDAELGGSVITKADVNVHDNHQICTNVEAVYPVIDLSVGQSDVEYKDKQSIVARLGYSGSWSIISEEAAPQRLSLHFEVLPDQTTQFVDECTYKKETAKKETAKKKSAKKKSAEKKSGDRILDELLRGDFSRYSGTYIARESDNDAYGGGEKLADVAFKPSADSGLGKMVIAKIKEYALEDGLTGERRKIDGVTYYAVVPKSYLGDTMFSASGYWAACAWEYGRPTAIIAQSSDGNFTSDQEKEVIQILSSFTEK